jgi:hypothetical protein
VSADRPSGGSLRGLEPGVDRVLRVQTTFHLADEAQGQAVAATLIDRAHELANSPECECDVDVSVEWIRSEALADPGAPGGVSAGDVVPTDRRSASEYPTAR